MTYQSHQRSDEMNGDHAATKKILFMVDACGFGVRRLHLSSIETKTGRG